MQSIVWQSVDLTLVILANDISKQLATEHLHSIELRPSSVLLQVKASSCSWMTSLCISQLLHLGCQQPASVQLPPLTAATLLKPRLLKGCHQSPQCSMVTPCTGCDTQATTTQPRLFGRHSGVCSRVAVCLLYASKCSRVPVCCQMFLIRMCHEGIIW